MRKKIIYVDDVHFSLVSVKGRLRKFYEIYPAQSVDKMFDLLGHVEPDLILLDINMPDIDGYEAIERLKADERYSNIPVIFLTGKIDKESVVKGLSLGAADYVSKPFSDADLIERIDCQLDPDKRKSSSKEEEDDDRQRILAVDDVPSMLRAVHYALRDKYKVYMLSRPEEVKDFLRTKTPDLILLDYEMPGLDGFDLIPIIREFPEHKETPIIFLTSKGTVDHLSAAMYFGAADFIVKPFNTKILKEKIAKYIKDPYQPQ